MTDVIRQLSNPSSRALAGSGCSWYALCARLLAARSQAQRLFGLVLPPHDMCWQEVARGGAAAAPVRSSIACVNQPRRPWTERRARRRTYSETLAPIPRRRSRALAGITGACHRRRRTSRRCAEQLGSGCSFAACPLALGPSPPLHLRSSAPCRKESATARDLIRAALHLADSQVLHTVVSDSPRSAPFLLERLKSLFGFDINAEDSVRAIGRGVPADKQFPQLPAAWCRQPPRGTRP